MNMPYPHLSSEKKEVIVPHWEKIEALRGFGVKSFVSGAKNLSGLRNKPDSAKKLPSSKDKFNRATSSLKSKSEAKGDVHRVILLPFLFFVLFPPFFDLILLLILGHTIDVRDRLNAAFDDKDSEATLTVHAAKSTEDDSINIMSLPVKQAEHCQSPTPFILTYVPGRITSGMFSDLALSVKQHFQQQLKKFIPKTEGDIANIC